jgi:uncharacterized membrane protein YhhN
MVTMKPIWLIFFIISAVTVFAGILFDVHMLYLTAKPMLMITLLLYFISASKGYPAWRFYVMAALVFSWGGDVFLMLYGMFTPGLVSFLVAHIFYITAYQKTGAASGELKLLDIMKFVLFGAVVMWLLYPGLSGMLLPVLAYMLVLLSMGVWAHKRRGATTAISFTLVSAGAMLFVVSDGLIAINKFAFEISAERILVMSTYIAAQYLIVQGLLKHEVTR